MEYLLAAHLEWIIQDPATAIVPAIWTGADFLDESFRAQHIQPRERGEHVKFPFVDMNDFLAKGSPQRTETSANKVCEVVDPRPKRATFIVGSPSPSSSPSPSGSSLSESSSSKDSEEVKALKEEVGQEEEGADTWMLGHYLRSFYVDASENDGIVYAMNMGLGRNPLTAQTNTTFLADDLNQYYRFVNWVELLDAVRDIQGQDGDLGTQFTYAWD
ncbi:hypothetical protein B0H63DRAFT_453289 [Podospora didyma]|uniref:Uncharacterized protein n=1 Tax=Podospora didyma TaxID=330526 RepID=A0AAE0N5X2_9PEZI|nr:hypothetical protein B0H63DRAFT_453289 [Podospora didyma]